MNAGLLQHRSYNEPTRNEIKFSERVIAFDVMYKYRREELISCIRSVA
jgi:hypothetical protein